MEPLWSDPEFVSTNKIQVISKDGKIREYTCPFPVFSSTAFPDLPAFKTVSVLEVAQTGNGRLMYKISGQYYDHAYFHFVFDILRGLTDPFYLR